MFDYEDEICRKIKEANCLEANELQAVEIALKLTACHDMLLNECLGLKLDENRFDFGLKHAIYKKQ